MLQRIEPKEFQRFYERMKEEFPPEELKSSAEFDDLLIEGKYQCFGLFDGDILQGYSLGMVTSAGFFWLDYLHVFREFQSLGIGSKLLKALLEEVAPNGILLETEICDSDDYNDQRNRRMRFYDRFNIQKLDFPYLFPCADGSYIDTLSLQYIPPKGKRHVSKEEFQKAIREAVSCIHKALPHAPGIMNRYIDQVPGLEVDFFTLDKVDMEDEEAIKAIGELIYYTDPYVYPAFFDNDIALSRKCAKALLRRDTLFHHENILLGKLNGKTAGFMVILDHFPKDNYEQMKAAMLESLGFLTPKFDHAMEGYFQTLNGEWEGKQIMSLAVLPQFRKKRVATKMLNSLPSRETYSLACVKDNAKARDLYRKCGYEYRFEYPGYTGIPCVELAKKGK